MSTLSSLVRLQDLAPGLDPERVRPGVLALVIVLALCVLTFLLWRSMNKQLKKVRFDEDTTDDGSPDQRHPEQRHTRTQSLTATRNGDDPDRGTGDVSGDGPPERG